jgi:hypothetical protein
MILTTVVLAYVDPSVQFVAVDHTYKLKKSFDVVKDVSYKHAKS